MKSDAKRKAEAFLKEIGYQKTELSLLKDFIQKQGYRIVEFHIGQNDPDVEVLIQNLKLYEGIYTRRGFTYADRNYRIVFIEKTLSDAEKLLVLAHEEGHIYCGHMHSAPVIGQDVQDEYEANEFAHYILHPNLSEKTIGTVRSHKRTFLISAIIAGVALVAVVLFFLIRKEQSYYGEYYITSAGNKYHKQNCIFVKNKNNVRRLTKEEFENGDYTPCEICLP